MNCAVYDAFAPFYDLEYGHKDNDLAFYLDAAARYGDPVLEIGVGTGRVAIALAKAGYRVTGIDNSPEMLARAQQKAAELPQEAASRLTLVSADMRNFALEQTFPLAIIPFRAFLHNLTVKDQLATLRAIRRQLKPKGVLAMDLFVPLYSVISGRNWRERIEPEELADPAQNLTIDIKVRHRPEKQLLIIRNRYHSKITGETKTAVMQYRYVFRFEMASLLRECGYRQIRVFGEFDGRPYNYSSGIMIFVAVKG
ncbi:MAG: class I SAM-dependent methyltransferase [candidate division KSB1 bacterium]|nr:class I SAM-dependent methyltransferase [candidate division KSB1 bacterium]